MPQPFELLALVRAHRDACVQGKSGYCADPVTERLTAPRQRLQREDLAALLQSQLGQPQPGF